MKRSLQSASTLIKLPGHVAGAGHDLVVVEEAAAGQISVVPGQLAADPHVALASLEAVDGTDVVEASARHVAARGRVRTRHHPRGAQRDGVHLRDSVEVVSK